MPYAPSVFQYLVNDVLRNILGKFIVACIDNISNWSTPTLMRCMFSTSAGFPGVWQLYQGLITIPLMALVLSDLKCLAWNPEQINTQVKYSQTIKTLSIYALLPTSASKLIPVLFMLPLHHFFPSRIYKH